MFTRKLALICALACAASAAAPRVAKAGDPPWVRVTSANFVVYSDAGEKRARAVSERLESFRALMASLFPAVVRAAHTDQVPVVAFRSDDDFKPFKPLYNGKPAHAAGVFLQAAEQGMMALDVTAWEGSSHVIFHEYIHRLLARRDRPVPIWFDEGVAELYSMAVARGTKAEIGRIVPGQIELLRERGLMPLDRLFAVGRDSPEYNELNKQTVFYAESWLLVHYVTLDKDQTRASALTQFAERVGNGEEPATAFKAAFGIDTAAMDKELKKYLFQLTVPFTSYTFEAPETAEARVEVAPPSEVEYYLGNTLAFQARFDEAKARYERAAEADKASPLPYEGLCFLGVLRGDMPGVRAAYAEAVKRGSQSFYTHYYFAAASIAAGDTHSPAVRASLEKAVEINPEFADAYARLADLAIGRGDVTAARSWAERGLKIEPSNTRMLGALANADIREAKYDEARKLLTRVAAEAADESARANAKSQLSQLDRMAAESRIRVGGAEIRGVITRVDCDAKTVTVHVRVNGRDKTFASPDSSALVVATLGPDGQGQETLGCGVEIGREAFVRFDPEASDPTTGVLRAVLFVKPAR